MLERRLIAIQGPTLLFAVLNLLHQEKLKNPSQKYEDILLLGGFSSDIKNSTLIAKRCVELARTWNFSAVHDTVLLEQLAFEGYLNFDSTVARLKKTIGNDFKVVYILRNWQLFNELIFAATPGVKKIIYGDTIGYFDCKANGFSTRFPVAANNPKGYLLPDEAKLILPIEVDTGGFELCPITQVEPTFLREIIAHCAHQIPEVKRFCNAILEKHANSFTLILTSNLTESSSAKNLESEINFYEDLVLSSTSVDDTLLIKGHPRQLNNQSHLLTKRLIEKGRRAIEMEGMETYTIECFAPFLIFEKIISPASSSSITLAYLCGSNIELNLKEELLDKYFNPSMKKYYVVERHLIQELAKQVYENKFHPIRRQDIERELSHYQTLPTLVFDKEVRMKKWEALKTLSALSLSTFPLATSRLVGFPEYIFQTCLGELIKKINKMKRGFIKLKKLLSVFGG